ncbi:MAG: ATP-binding protein [Gammaproteobacteria bacterium]
MLSDKEQFDTNLIAVIEAMHDPIIITDQTGKIVLTNNLTEKLFKYSKAELVNLPVENLIPERFRTQHILSREAYTTSPFVRQMCTGAITHDLVGIKKDFEEFPIDISLSPLNINGKTFILVGMRDLTERYAYEQKLKISLEHVDNICHEVRNPFNGIYGIIPILTKSFEALKLNQPPSEQTKPVSIEIEHLLELIQLCADQEKVLLDNVLTLSKLTNGKIELNPVAFELIKTLQNTVQIFSAQLNKKKLTLQLNLPEHPVWVKTDLHQLSEVIINLISNAIKFTEQGIITLTVIVEQPTPSFVTEKEEQTTINFIVKDTGIGMFPHEITNLFQRFIQANNRTGEKYGGSGLGLSISKKIIELMGGTIQVNSEIGQGTTFSFFIKCNNLTEQEILQVTQSTQSSRSDVIHTPRLNGKKFLIVEDNQINTTIFLKQLASTNCICYTASNGITALEEHEKTHFDLIFMDLEMPGLNGFDTTKEIRKKESLLSRHTPIIGVSGYSLGSEKANLALQCGMNAYLAKPYTPKELFELIEQHILVKDSASSIEPTSSEIILYTPRFTKLTVAASSSSTLENSSADNLYQKEPTSKTTPKKSTSCQFHKKRSSQALEQIANNYVNPFEAPTQSTSPKHRQNRTINSNKCTIL